MNKLSKNLRFHLVRSGVKPQFWENYLETKLGISSEEAAILIGGESQNLDAFNQKKLEDLLQAPVARLESEGLWQDLSADEIASLNLRYLMDLLPYGGKTKFADTLEVDGSTISRWRAGGQVPGKRKMSAVKAFFHLSEDVDLHRDLVFNFETPVGEEEKRKWLKARIEELDSNSLKELFPSLWKLLK